MTGNGIALIGNGIAPPTHVWDHRTADACVFSAEAARILPRLETRVLPVALPGERVVLTFGNRPPQELSLLNRLGFGCREEDLVFVNSELPDGTPRLFADGTIISPFTSASTMTHNLATHEPGCSFHGCCLDIAVRANRKATLQDLASDKISVPEGRFVPTSGATRDAITDLLTRYPVVVYKPDHSASGIGQVRFDRSSDLFHAALDDLYYPGVVQEFVRKTCDLSVQFEIMVNSGYAIGNGPPVQMILRELTGQIVSHEGDYLGGFYPAQIPQILEERIRSMARAVVGQLVNLGYRGPGSIDFLVNEDSGEIWVSDVNARVAAPWYALQMIRRRLYRPLPFIMRSFRIPVGMPISAFEELFHKHLFSWVNKEGFVPFAFLPEVGFCYGVVFAEDPERCRQLDQIIEQVKRPLHNAS